MISFKQYLKDEKFDRITELEEGIFSGFISYIRGVFSKIVNAFKSAFRQLASKLGFGQIISMKIVTPLLEANEAGQDTKSRLGYYSEYVCGVALAKIIEDKGLKLPSSSTSSSLEKVRKSFVDSKLKSLSNFKSLSGEIKRMEDAGKAMADKIFSDMITETADLKVTQFDIQLTGDSLKGEGKADIILRARKKSEGEVIKEIAASLKAYKSSSINLANSTLISFFASITGDKDFTSKALEKQQSIIFDTMVDAYLKDNKGKSKADATAFLANKNMSASDKKKFSKYKNEGRRISKESQIDTAKIMVSEFNKLYRSGKQKINNNLLKLIGMDGSDDFYAAIGEGKKMRVISSKQSPEMKKFLKDIRDKKLNIEMEPKPGSSGRASVTVRLMVGDTELSKSSITMTDTGIGSAGMTPSKGQIKTNFWFNFNDIS